MKEHESNKTNSDELEKIGKVYYYYNDDVTYEPADKLGLNEAYTGSIIYLDSNNFLHKLNAPAWYNAYGTFTEYWIHGKLYKTKEEWELEVHRLLMLEEL